MDFVSDQLACGRRFRVLNIIDDYSRPVHRSDNAVGQIVDTSPGGERVARFLDALSRKRSLPKTLVCDNGSE